jgi:hypothetical protein
MARLRLLRERRAAHLTGTAGPPASPGFASPAPASPALLTPPPAPVVPPAPAHVESPDAAKPRPWRWWERPPGEPLNRGRWQRRQLDAASALHPPVLATPAPVAAPTPTQAEPHPAASGTVAAKRAVPRPRAPAAPRAPHPRGGGRRRL